MSTVPPRIAKRCQDVVVWLADRVFENKRTLGTRLVGSNPPAHLDDTGRSYSGSDTRWPVPPFDHSGGANHSTFPDVFPVSEDVTV